ncbi:hypothetical protein [Chryseobacterium sp.]|nr:hypothetical protein [Chryseobacterium sp.]
MKLRIIPTSEGYFDVISNQYIYHYGNVSELVMNVKKNKSLIFSTYLKE